MTEILILLIIYCTITIINILLLKFIIKDDHGDAGFAFILTFLPCFHIIGLAIFTVLSINKADICEKFSEFIKQ